MMRRRNPPILRELANVQRDAGWFAADAASRGDHARAREWSELSLTVGYCLRDAAKMMAERTTATLARSEGWTR